MQTSMFTSARQDWATPVEFYDKLNIEFNFTIDVCAHENNFKHSRYWSPKDDALSKDWSGEICWMNPPYGSEIGAWMEKAYRESLCGATVVCLVPARTDTKWFHLWVLDKAEIRFIKGRIRFVGAPARAPFPSIIVVYNKGRNV